MAYSLFMSQLDFEDSQPPRSRVGKPLRLLLGVGVISGALAIGSTLAANINLNSGAPVEFGQGMVQATACDDQVTITPFSTFVNEVGAGSHLLTSVKISGIDSSSDKCSGKIFVIKAYSENEQLNIFNYSDSSVPITQDYNSIEIINSGGVFSWVSGGTDGDDLINDENVGDPARDITDTSFTVSFTSNVIPISRTALAIAENVKRITVETYDGDLLNDRIFSTSQFGIYIDGNSLLTGIYDEDALPSGNFDGSCDEPFCFGYLTINDWIANAPDEDLANFNNDLGFSALTRTQISNSLTFKFTYNPSEELNLRWNMQPLFLGEPISIYGSEISIDGAIMGFDGSTGYFMPVGGGLSEAIFFSVDGRLQSNSSIGPWIPYGDQPSRSVPIRNISELWMLSSDPYYE